MCVSTWKFVWKTRIIIEPSFDKVGNYLKRLYAGTCSVPASRISRMNKKYVLALKHIWKSKYVCEVSKPVKREINCITMNYTYLKIFCRFITIIESHLFFVSMATSVIKTKASKGISDRFILLVHLD